MSVKWLLTATVALLVMLAPLSAQAFECPKHFAAAQAAIDKVTADMEADTPWKRTEDKALVQTLLDDAKSLLSSAKHNHEDPQSADDHAHAIAKADAALAYAKATEKFHFDLLAK